MTTHVHLTGDSNYFEDFEVGRRMRHARSATIAEVENNFISKQVMNTAQAHWNEAITADSPLGEGRLVFGLVTGSMTVGLASQDTAENALAELGLDNVRFNKPVHHGDTVTAYTEVLATDPADCRDDAGVVRFKHWGRNQYGDIVCELERIVLIKRRSHWRHHPTTNEEPAGP
ncbi:MAG: MaoC family dehydratase [Acidimicrobiaceae bacterium]|nr:MaoC family dehydratase [Acidimicrobiaceae bacterium]MXW60816.1 MaoC family dehydratase [Acidimicrobiaceae bacterium]MYA74141.1 MaoC family dehydratase [Acidimicrobiaceae bacterium]MYC42435.1 MaoC family dehydratase [Acidimicrobiaceae bacterium]MYG55261.1 MaoC family dehydratase [Acidimicrobiaceae bacterium]